MEAREEIGKRETIRVPREACSPPCGVPGFELTCRGYALEIVLRARHAEFESVEMLIEAARRAGRLEEIQRHAVRL